MQKIMRVIRAIFTVLAITSLGLFFVEYVIVEFAPEYHDHFFEFAPG